MSGQTFSSILLLWSNPLSMAGVTVSYGVSYMSVQPGVNLPLTYQLTVSSNMTTITNLLSGTQYNITVVTIGVYNLSSSFINLNAYTGSAQHSMHLIKGVDYCMYFNMVNCFIICVCPVPNTVQNLSVSNVSTNSVSLTWLPPNGTSSLFSYNINISSLGQTFNTTSSNYQITQLQPGTQYNCSVTTLIVAGNIFGPSQFIQCNTSESTSHTCKSKRLH